MNENAPSPFPRTHAKAEAIHHRYEELHRDLERSTPREQLEGLARLGFHDTEIAKAMSRPQDSINVLRMTGLADEFTAERLRSFAASCGVITDLPSIPSVSDWFRTPILSGLASGAAALTERHPDVFVAQAEERCTPLDLANKNAGFELDLAAGINSPAEVLARQHQWMCDRVFC
ncbi:hypothetical protein [Streptomyces sp. NPDC091416]|uniref:hypothetical protein n=1 Tax=Streptomyces sp. NPDC091416 TaxID=3366003 RepID=UPI0038293571